MQFLFQTQIVGGCHYTQSIEILLIIANELHEYALSSCSKTKNSPSCWHVHQHTLFCMFHNDRTFYIAS